MAYKFIYLVILRKLMKLCRVVIASPAYERGREVSCFVDDERLIFEYIHVLAYCSQVNEFHYTFYFYIRKPHYYLPSNS